MTPPKPPAHPAMALVGFPASLVWLLLCGAFMAGELSLVGPGNWLPERWQARFAPPPPAFPVTRSMGGTPENIWTQGKFATHYGGKMDR